ncbi:hypothetical protein EVG20_g11150 [Dentipellis fragilis]|uniref:Uncharacterized protein n=1 Tax=Dentipellis fragilis TaxID=205917 RepID=A0A4Y9XP27_9AGAM|nr:hypothetical protein EVG20_g11150 [Dentipellis fragilis]
MPQASNYDHSISIISFERERDLFAAFVTMQWTEKQRVSKYAPYRVDLHWFAARETVETFNISTASRLFLTMDTLAVLQVLSSLSRGDHQPHSQLSMRAAHLFKTFDDTYFDEDTVSFERHTCNFLRYVAVIDANAKSAWRHTSQLPSQSRRWETPKSYEISRIKDARRDAGFSRLFSLGFVLPSPHELGSTPCHRASR